MWSYYGGKGRIVKLYPKPEYEKIIEPFAGSAKYALKYWDRDVTLVDKYDVVIDIWKWLRLCSKDDIKRFPMLKKGDHIDNVKWDCREMKLLAGFIYGYGRRSPQSSNSCKDHEFNKVIERIANNVDKIRHWKFVNVSYESLPNYKATWFIDPPYQDRGIRYVCNSKQIDYEQLSDWCMSRYGQVIVCEASGANWLPFEPLCESVSSRCSKYTEVMFHLNR